MLHVRHSEIAGMLMLITGIYRKASSSSSSSSRNESPTLRKAVQIKAAATGVRRLTTPRHRDGPGAQSNNRCTVVLTFFALNTASVILPTLGAFRSCRCRRRRVDDKASPAGERNLDCARGSPPPPSSSCELPLSSDTFFG